MNCLAIVLVICSLGCLQEATASERRWPFIPARPTRPPRPTIPPTPAKNETLVLVHTLFRHGQRTPGSAIYTSNPYGNESFYQPYGYGQLTNDGKRTEYKIGQTLRKRYNDFLGETYSITLLDAWSTDFNRTKMSLQMVLAGLWPPTGDQIWRPWLNWQPIPYNYNSKSVELSGTSVCTNYATLLSEVQDSDEIQGLLEVYDDVFEYLTNKTGATVDSPSGAFSIYFESIAQSDFGYPLEDWLEPVFPQTVEKITKDVYYIATNTTALKKIAGGFLLKKILQDTQNKIDGSSERKMYLYSAHEKNVALFLLTLGVFEDKIPVYGSHVLLEVHLIDGVYGVKIFYNDWTTPEPYPLVIPGCEEFCPLDQFQELLAEVIPTDDDCE